MLRTITLAVGRYRVGDQHDYPRGVWNRLADCAKMPLDKFSRVVSENPTHQSTTKGARPKIHHRHGSTQ